MAAMKTTRLPPPRRDCRRPSVIVLCAKLDSRSLKYDNTRPFLFLLSIEFFGLIRDTFRKNHGDAQRNGVNETAVVRIAILMIA